MGLLESIGGAIGGVISGLTGAGQSAAQTISQGGSSVSRAIQSAGNAAAQGYGSLYTGATELVSGSGQALSQAIQGTQSSLGSITSSLESRAGVSGGTSFQSQLTGATVPTLQQGAQGIQASQATGLLKKTSEPTGGGLSISSFLGGAAETVQKGATALTGMALATPLFAPVVAGVAGAGIVASSFGIGSKQAESTQKAISAGSVTEGAALPTTTLLSPQQTSKGAITLYVPYGEQAQQKVTDISNVVYDPTGGAFAAYTVPAGHSISNIVAGGSTGALQSGMFSTKPLTPVVLSQQKATLVPEANVSAAQAVLTNPQDYSRLGAERYGGQVLSLATPTAPGAKYGEYPAGSGNLAFLVNPQGVNFTKENWAEVPWRIETTTTPQWATVDTTGKLSAAPSMLLEKAGITEMIRTTKTVGGAAEVTQRGATPEIVSDVIRPSGLQLALQPKGYSEDLLTTFAVRFGESTASVPLVGDVLKGIFGAETFTPMREVTTKEATVTSPISTTKGESYQTVEALEGGGYKITTFTPVTTKSEQATQLTKVSTPMKTEWQGLEEAVAGKTTAALPEWKYKGDNLALAIASGGYETLKEKPLTAAVYVAGGALMAAGGEALLGLGTSTMAATAGTSLAPVASAATFLSTKAFPIALGVLYGADIARTGLQPTTERGGLLGGPVTFHPTGESMYAMGGRITTEAVPMAVGGLTFAYRQQIGEGISARLPDLSVSYGTGKVAQGAVSDTGFGATIKPASTEQFKGLTYSKIEGISVSGTPFSVEGMQGEYLWSRAAAGVGPERTGFVYVPYRGEVVDLTFRTPEPISRAIFGEAGRTTKVVTEPYYLEGTTPARFTTVEPRALPEAVMKVGAGEPIETFDLSGLGVPQYTTAPAMGDIYTGEGVLSIGAASRVGGIKMTPEMGMEYIKARYPEQGSIWERYMTETQQLRPTRPTLQVQMEERTREVPTIDLRPYMEPLNLNIKTAEELRMAPYQERYAQLGAAPEVKAAKAVPQYNLLEARISPLEQYQVAEAERMRAYSLGYTIEAKAVPQLAAITGVSAETAVATKTIADTKLDLAVATIPATEVTTKTKVETQVLPLTETALATEVATALQTRTLEQTKLDERTETIFAFKVEPITIPETSVITVPLTETKLLKDVIIIPPTTIPKFGWPGAGGGSSGGGSKLFRPFTERYYAGLGITREAFYGPARASGRYKGISTATKPIRPAQQGRTITFSRSQPMARRTKKGRYII